MDTQLAELYASHHTAMIERHAAALRAEGYDWAVLYSGRERYLFLDDRPATFAANPHFRSVVPLPDHAGGAVVFGTDGTSKLVFCQPEDYWHAPPQAPDSDWTRHFELVVIREPGAIDKALDGLSGRVAIIGDETTPAGVGGLGELNPAGLVHRLHFERAAKTAYEVECMRRANAIAVRGHVAARAAFDDGASEFEINLAYNRACEQDVELPYDSIVALNEHGAVLHYTARETATPPEHRSFLIDAGASYNGYAADITRTYAANDDRFAGLIDSMESLQQQICTRATDGTNYVELHLHAHELIGAVLHEHGVIRCTAAAAVEQGITATFFPHGLGHYIGTQVHDIGGHQASAAGDMQPPPAEHPFLRLTRPLTPGTVCTIEPGIYFIDMLLQRHAGSPEIHWERVDALRPYGGVRIEDDIHVTASGVENLSRDQFALV